MALSTHVRPFPATWLSAVNADGALFGGTWMRAKFAALRLCEEMTLDQRYLAVLKDLEDELRVATEGSDWHELLCRKIAHLLGAMTERMEGR